MAKYLGHVYRIFNNKKHANTSLWQLSIRRLCTRHRNIRKCKTRLLLPSLSGIGVNLTVSTSWRHKHSYSVQSSLAIWSLLYVAAANKTIMDSSQVCCMHILAHQSKRKGNYSFHKINKIAFKAKANHLHACYIWLSDPNLDQMIIHLMSFTLIYTVSHKKPTPHAVHTARVHVLLYRQYSISIVISFYTRWNKT